MSPQFSLSSDQILGISGTEKLLLFWTAAVVTNLHTHTRDDTYYFQSSLYLSQFPPGQHLDVWTDLLPRSRLARPQFDVPRYQLVPTCRWQRTLGYWRNHPSKCRAKNSFCRTDINRRQSKKNITGSCRDRQMATSVISNYGWVLLWEWPSLGWFGHSLIDRIMVGE